MNQNQSTVNQNQSMDLASKVRFHSKEFSKIRTNLVLGYTQFLLIEHLYLLQIQFFHSVTNLITPLFFYPLFPFYYQTDKGSPAAEPDPTRRPDSSPAADTDKDPSAAAASAAASTAAAVSARPV